MTVFIDGIVHVFCNSCNIQSSLTAMYCTLYMYFDLTHDKRLFHETKKSVFLWNLAALPSSDRHTKNNNSKKNYEENTKKIRAYQSE